MVHLSDEQRTKAAEFVAELEQATRRGDIVWDVEIVGDGARRYSAGAIFSNGAVGCISLMNAGLLILNSHEYREPDVKLANLWNLVGGPNDHLLQMATDGLRQRATEMNCGGVDLNEMGVGSCGAR